MPLIKKSAGFTLIELSIVLIIIGLILGGVLVGRDLIEAAKLRKQIGQFESVALAANTFKNKYGCLAGDCNKANSLGLGNDGDGDGVVSQAVTPEELALFMQHLIAAGLVTSDGANDNHNLPSYYPPARLMMGEQTEGPPPGRHTANHLVLACELNECAPSGIGIVGDHGVSVSPYVNWGIDSKIDDGDPFHGRVRAIRGYTDHFSLDDITQGDDVYPLYGPLGANSVTCVDDSVNPALYNLKQQANTCLPIVRLP